MKRLVCFFLAVLLVPVLAFSASAAEVYEFEYMAMPYVLSDSFDFNLGSDGLYMDGLLPAGVYHFSVYDGDQLIFSTVDPIVLRFETLVEIGSCSRFSLIISDVTLSFIVLRTDVFSDPVTIIGLEEGSLSCTLAVATRIGDLPGSDDIGLISFLDSVKTGFIEYSTSNLVKVIVSGLILACSPVMAWFAYRFIKRKVANSVFKGRL